MTKEYFSQLHTETDGLSVNTRYFIYQYIFGEILNREGYGVMLPPDQYRNLYGTLPNIGEEAPGMVIHWADEKAREKGRKGRTPIKPGRYVKKYFGLDDKQAEAFVDAFKKYLEGDSTDNLRVLRSKSADTFESVYSIEELAPQHNFDTTTFCKRLRDSCMQGDKFATEFHPAKVYGAGDLEIVYVVDYAGKLYGRTIAWPEKEIYGPIYASSMKVHDLIEKTLEGENFCQTLDFDGARLLRIEHDDDSFVGPYLDFGGSAVNDHGTYLKIKEGGDIQFTETDGIQSMNTQWCECCGDMVRTTESVIYNERGRTEQWCDTCVDCESFICKYTLQRVSYTLQHVVIDRNYREISVGPEAFEDNFIYSDSEDQDIHVDIAFMDIHGDWHIDTRKDEYLEVKGTNEWIPECDLESEGYVKIRDTRECIHKDNLESEGYVMDGDSGECIYKVLANA